MKLIRARNVHDALPEALDLLVRGGYQRSSRNGDVLVMDEPVTTVYERPCERVMTWAERDANPFFHFYEALWMLAGKNEVAPLARIVSRMKDFSDDGVTFGGAYGYRWRSAFGFDQLAVIAANLVADPNDRRQVLQIWHPTDLVSQKNKKDLPCNHAVNFQISPEGTLNMYVHNRSNDIVWGCYGANAVHFSMLQEVMAAWIGCAVGKYWQISTNWHGYLTTVNPLLSLIRYARTTSAGRFTPHENTSIYESKCTPFPMVNGHIQDWFSDLEEFMEKEEEGDYSDIFFRRVAAPMVAAHKAYKVSRPAGYAMCKNIGADDWRQAATEWMYRRIVAQRKAEDDGVLHEQ